MSPRLIHKVFAAQVQARAKEVAVRHGDDDLTYGELDRRSNQLAHHLQALGVGPETLVCLYLDRGPYLVVAILAVLKAGGAYVPIDLAYPEERCRFIFQDAHPLVVLTEQKLMDRVARHSGTTLSLDGESEIISRQSDRAVSASVTPANAAYVIYTSGSTGKPKGVVVTHANVVRLFRSTEHWFHFTSSDVWTLFHSFAFDFSVWEMWGALLYGGKLVVVPYAVSRSPAVFHQLLVDERVTVLNQTPSAFRQLIWADAAALAGAKLNLRWVIFGGEALELQSLKPWLDRHGDQQPRLINMYGITETTVHVTYRPISRQDVETGRGSVIGVPIPDLSVHVLDEQLQPCPVGVSGEMFVGGAGLARGYLNRPELTAERFIVAPGQPEPGERWYRSGDLARRLPDGDLEYLGRIDDQVKIRGFRIELGEIETALNSHPNVRESAVIANGDLTGDKRLVAYLVAEPDWPSIEAMQQFLKTRLPDYMVPAQFVHLDRLPLTVNGKVDRRALPPPNRLRPVLSNPFVPPKTPEERALAAIWRSVLQIDPVGLHDNFFALGGDSIRSIQVLAKAQEAGLALSLEQLFEQPTIHQLARSRSAPSQETLGHQMPFADIASKDRAKLPPDLETAYPMTKLQLGMLFHGSLDPATAVFHDVFSFRLRMPLDEAKLRQAVDSLGARHPIYRTSFDLGNYSEPLQLLHRRTAIPLTFEDLTHLDQATQKAALAEWVEKEKRRAFNWSRPPLMRLHVQRYAPELFQFVVSFHHAIMDGWSLAAMLTELFQEYAALLADRHLEFPPPPVTYHDFVHLERQAMASLKTREYWRRKLDQPTRHRLPRWPAPLRKGGKEQVRGPELEVSPEVLRRLQALAQSQGVPLRTVLLAAHCRVMNLVTGQSDILTGLVSNGRPQVVGGERLIGLFLNTLPFRVDLHGGTWAELVQQTFQAERELLPHRRLPLSEIQQLAGGEPLFETVFDFVQFHVYRDLPGWQDQSFLEDHYFEANNFAFYMTFILAASGSQLQLHCDYDPNQLGEPQVHALSQYYLTTLQAIAQSPDARYETQPLLPAAERLQLLVEWNRTERSWPQECCVHQLIEQQVARTPEAMAAVFENQCLTYAELDRQASALARSLSAWGVQPNHLVGIQTSRSLEMLVAMLAVLKAGGAYLPLDPAFPQERLDFMRSDAGVNIVLTDRRCASVPRPATGRVVRIEDVSIEASDANRNGIPETEGSRLTPEHLAYVIYTSGSTGTPKGVAVPHRALANFLLSMQGEPGLNAGDTLLAVTTLSFDIAALELLLPLTVGARVVIASEKTTLDPEALATALATHQVTVMQATPTTWRALVSSGWLGSRKLRALSGGEGLSPELARQLLDRCGEVWNLYGPTETTVWSCLHRVDRGPGPVPIGRPIANTEIYILDQHGQVVPTGSEGEICIGGVGLARGYLHRPELTAERFVPNPFKSGTQLYSTGDLGRYLPDGKLICAGRTDHQVKIRGFRIELGEVETVLQRHPAVTAAVVVGRDEGIAGKKLVAYYTVGNGHPPSTGALRQWLEGQLPAHMVPSAFVLMADLPKTPNGKVDRQRLPEPAAVRPELETHFEAPRTPLEKRLAALWKEVLHLNEVGIHDSFFALGGHSLLAMQIIGRLSHELRLDLSVALLFEHPDIAGLSLAILDLFLKRDGGRQGLADHHPAQPGRVRAETSGAN